MNASALQPVFLLHSEVRLELSISLNLILDGLIILNFSIHLGRRQYIWLAIVSTLALGIG